jgi:hypothetical protein
MQRIITTIGLAAMFAFGCGSDDDAGSTTSDSADTTSSTGTGTGGGGGGGNGGIGGGTGNTATPSGLDCDATYTTPDPGGVSAGSCLTQTLTCGDVVEHTNTGGSTHFGTAEGEQFWTCSGTASGDDFDGPERAYRVEVDASTKAIRAHLESCESSWMMYYRGGPSCPVAALDSCGYGLNADDPTNGKDQTAEILLGENRVVFLVIEGNDNDGGNFRLTIECL